MQLAEPIVVVVPSHTSKNTSYAVVFPTIEQPYCNCKGFGYRRTCSHIKEAADQLLKQVVQDNWPQQPYKPSYCFVCGAKLTSTHAASPINKCAACYRAETLGRHQQG